MGTNNRGQQLCCPLFILKGEINNLKKQEKLKIYYIDGEYVDYLRKWDKKVPLNKNKTRPYIGIVYKYKNQEYFAPLTSPKPKHLKMNPKTIDIYKIEDGKLGIININNMIPTPKECLIEAIPNVDDEKYKILLQKQISFINKKNNSKILIDKVYYFQKMYRKGFLDPKILNRTCNFVLLEEKCEKWIKMMN